MSTSPSLRRFERQKKLCPGQMNRSSDRNTEQRRATVVTPFFCLFRNIQLCRNMRAKRKKLHTAEEKSKILYFRITITSAQLSSAQLSSPPLALPCLLARLWPRRPSKLGSSVQFGLSAFSFCLFVYISAYVHIYSIFACISRKKRITVSSPHFMDSESS